MLNDVLNALLMAGMPLLIISFCFYYWSYKTHLINPNPEPADASKDHNITKKSAAEPKNIIVRKWTTFGGGYYGLMALIVFVHAEFFEVIDVIANFSLSIDEGNLLSALINQFVQFLINSFMNFITAILWFNYWQDILPIDNGFVWLGFSYAGYLLGEYLAKYYLAIPKN